MLAEVGSNPAREMGAAILMKRGMRPGQLEPFMLASSSTCRGWSTKSPTAPSPSMRATAERRGMWEMATGKP
jgi:hypothetical protein